VPLWLEIFTTKRGSYFRHIAKFYEIKAEIG
jgi:hypothetical protein